MITGISGLKRHPMTMPYACIYYTEEYLWEISFILYSPEN